MAKKLNPKIFVVARQNEAANDVLFDSFRADFSMVHTRVVAQECISILTTPLLARFLGALREANESWSKQVCSRLEGICEGLVPEVWDIGMGARAAPAVHKALMNHQPIRVGQLMRDNANWEVVLPAVILMIVRNGQSLSPAGRRIRVAGRRCAIDRRPAHRAFHTPSVAAECQRAGLHPHRPGPARRLAVASSFRQTAGKVGRRVRPRAVNPSPRARCP